MNVKVSYPHGLARADFKDSNAAACSAQDSSWTDKSLLWLGCNRGEHFGHECSGRMLLNKEQAIVLMDLLQRFLENGTIGEAAEETP